MENLIRVARNSQTGQIVSQSNNNPEKGYFLLKSKYTSFEGGFINRQVRTAVISGDIDLLQELNLKEGQVFPGKIIAKESNFPQFEGQEPVINPTTGEIVLKFGKPLYRQYVYTENTQATDTWLYEQPEAPEEFEDEIEEAAVAPKTAPKAKSAKTTSRAVEDLPF